MSSADDGQPLDWSQRISARRVRVPPLAGALTYLDKAYVQGDGWGRIPGLPPELHPSALAAEAMAAASETPPWDLANVAMGFCAPGRPVDDLPLSQLTDLLRLLGASDEAGGERGRRLVDLAHARLAAPDAGSRLTTGTLATLLQTLRSQYADRESEFMPWLDHLLERQLDDGSWPSGTAGASSESATALALGAIQGAPGERARTASARAAAWLEGRIRDAGWDAVGSTPDVGTKSVVLRALGASEHSDVTVLEDGVDWMLANVNSDHGWGSVVGGESTVDATATAVLALVAAGQHEFVPGRLALAAVHDLEARVRSKDAELSTLDARINDEVQVRGGRLAGEVTRLKQRERELQAELDDARRSAASSRLALDELYQVARTSPAPSAPLRRRTTWTVPYFFMAAAIAATATSIAFAIAGTSQAWYWIAVAAGGVVLPLGASALFSYRETTRRREALETLSQTDDDDFELAPLRGRFIAISRFWPEDVQEYVIRSLLSELTQISTREVESYARYRLERVGMGSSDQAELLDWTRDFAMLSPASRRLLTDQLRRAQLGLT